MAPLAPAGDYDTTAPARSPGGKFSSANVKSDLEWTIHRAARTPGPGHYPGVDRALTLCSRSSPKFSLSGRTGPPSLPLPFGAVADRRSSTSGAPAAAALEGTDSEPPGGAGGERGTGVVGGGRGAAAGKVQRSVEAHAERVKAAVARSALTRKWRGHAGYGPSFFI